MKILIVTATYIPSTNGVAISTKLVKDLLESKGHEVIVLAPTHKDAKKERGVIRFSSIDNKIADDYPIPLLPGIRSLYKLYGESNPDIVHAMHPFHIGDFARIVSIHYKVPLVFTYHTLYDSYSEKYAKKLPKDLKKRFIQNRVDSYVEKCDLVIAPSKFIKTDLKKKHNELKIKIIPTPVSGIKIPQQSKEVLRSKLSIPKDEAPADLRPGHLLPALRREQNLSEAEHTSHSSASLRTRCSAKGDKTILLNVGRLAPEKNIDKVVRAMEYLPEEYYLVVIGDGPDKDRLLKLTKRYKLDNRIKFCGKVGHMEIGKYYKASDIFVYSSETETQGIVFLEALVFGLPIVAVRSGASEELVNKKVGKLTKSKSKSIAMGVLEIENEGIKKYSEQAVKLGKKYSTERMAKDLITAYKEAVVDDVYNRSSRNI